MFRDRVIGQGNGAGSSATTTERRLVIRTGLLPSTVAMFSSRVRSDLLRFSCPSKRRVSRIRRATTSELYVPSERHTLAKSHHALSIFF